MRRQSTVLKKVKEVADLLSLPTDTGDWHQDFANLLKSPSGGERIVVAPKLCEGFVYAYTCHIHPSMSGPGDVNTAGSQPGTPFPFLPLVVPRR